MSYDIFADVGLDKAKCLALHSAIIAEIERSDIEGPEAIFVLMSLIGDAVKVNGMATEEVFQTFTIALRAFTEAGPKPS